MVVRQRISRSVVFAIANRSASTILKVMIAASVTAIITKSNGCASDVTYRIVITPAAI